MEESNPAIAGAKKALTGVTEVRKETELWKFATDAGHFSQTGMLVIGFGPGDEGLAHTVEESISIADMELGLRGNLVLARDWPRLARIEGFS